MPGNRRKPYRVRITDGWDTDPETGRSKQVYRTIGYFATYQEASIALAKYHQNPLSLEPETTFEEIYRRWSAEKYEHASRSTVASYTSAYNAVPMLHPLVFKEIRRNHLQNAIDTCGKGYATLQNIKIVIGFMFRYAIQNDLVEKDYSKFIDIAKHKPDLDEQESIHTDVKPEEIAALWNHTDDAIARTTLMLIYSGLRISEFCALTRADVDLQARIINIRKSKTAAGRRRVPIALKTLPFWTEQKLPEKELSDSDINRIANNFRKSMNRLTAFGLEEHLPHDTRHTCATLLHNAAVDGYTVKRILGHHEPDITANVYTHLSDDVLLNAIDRI